MKIEAGESLIYSWLRHEKQCQLAQTNWKPSYYWEIDRFDELTAIAEKFGAYYKDKYGYDIYNGRTVEQLLKQAEIDAIGIAFSESAHSIFAVDIAYHQAGLNYGDKEKTLNKIIQKCVRTALCLYGYFNIATGEIIFASPKINPAIEKELIPLFEELTYLIKEFGLEFSVLLCCNDAFSTEIMQPIIDKGANIADTSELFLRSIQLYQMFPPSTVKHAASIHKLGANAEKRNGDNTFGKAIGKIPLWASNKEQNNHKIIRAYFQLLNECGRVNRPILEARCQNMQEHPDVYVRDFRGNFASMKTDKGNSHGKVFTDDGYNIGIWDAVAEVLEQHRGMFLM